jgi:hypothetical protein
MLTVYQIFIDGAAGWWTVKPKDFEEEIISNYYLEHDREIPQGKLIKVMNDINHMKIGDHIYFDNMELVCFEMPEEDFAKTPEFMGW